MATDEMMVSDEAMRCGFVALIGAPNAGKSTLINQLVGAKVSIVSRKVQTTRALVRGIAIKDTAQIIFVDTPGIFTPKRRLERAMVTSAWGGAGDADAVALVLDARKGVDEEAEAIIEGLKNIKQDAFLILNKVDLVERPSLLKLAEDVNAHFPFKETFMVSALTGSGVPKVLERFAALMPMSHWLYPEDQVSDAPLRMLASEITREKLFERLHDELPYRSTVETDQWQERKDGSVRIEQTIFVERETQRMIVLGKGGQQIRTIGELARKEIGLEIEKPVHLFLHVKVRENWSDDPARYREMGLEFPK
ncbi:MAG: GTPase Era [Alphaproteobacteria bacterium]|nr:GTPase Era [Alphaproteobacteria bacterium]